MPHQVNQLRNSLFQQGVRLIAVSKYSSDREVEQMIADGQLDFGESRPQQLRDRAQQWPQCHWHMLGPLQKNKAKYIAAYAHTWHSLCDLALAAEVAKQVRNRRLPVLIQLNISAEAQKQGVTPDELEPFYAQLCQFKQLHVVGLMGMAAKGSDPRSSFQLLSQCRSKLSTVLPELSMGMSSDWKIAIEEGATMVRLGRALFDANPLSDH